MPSETSATLVQTVDARPATPLAAWLHQLMWSQGWDVAVRVANLAWAGWMMLGQIVGVLNIIAHRADHGTAVFVTAVAARIAVIMFLSLLMVAVVSRARPLAKTSGLWSRITAMGGSFIPSFVFLLPRNDDVVLVNILSFSLFAVGYGFTVYALAYLNRSFSIMPEARRLVTDGPYRRLRHPVYLFEEIGVIGLALPFASVWALLWLLVHAACQLQRIKNEERVLRGAFPEYDDYARTTARLIPGLY